MSKLPHHTPDGTRQFLLSMCSQAEIQLAQQSIQQQPQLAVLAQANLDMTTVLDLLRP